MTALGCLWLAYRAVVNSANCKLVLVTATRTVTWTEVLDLDVRWRSTCQIVEDTDSVVWFGKSCRLMGTFSSLGNAPKFRVSKGEIVKTSSLKFQVWKFKELYS
jgi:hypothetical protein